MELELVWEAETLAKKRAQAWSSTTVFWTLARGIFVWLACLFWEDKGNTDNASILYSFIYTNRIVLVNK